MSRRHKPRVRIMPSAYFAEGDTREALIASLGRRIILSTGRGDTRLSLDEAYAIRDSLVDAIQRQLEVECFEKAGDPPPKPRR